MKTRLFEILDNALQNKYQDSKIILELLAYIESVHQKAHSSYKVAYEIYRVHPDPAQAYRHRKHLGYCWTKGEAQKLINKHQAHYNPIHVIKLEGMWHRINVTALDIDGTGDNAKQSHLDPIRELT